jgi:hypothetical protein
MATTHESLHLDEQTFVQWKTVDIPASFIWIIIFFNGPFEYGTYQRGTIKFCMLRDV